jgi:hypothetical protein
MVVCDDDRIFPNKIDPFDWFIPNLLDGLAYGAMSTTPRVVALGAISTPCLRHGSCAMMFTFFSNKIDPFDWFIPNLLDGLTYGAMSITPRVVALRAILTPCQKQGSCATMLAFFSNKFDPLNWFLPNLLDARS